MSKSTPAVKPIPEGMTVDALKNKLVGEAATELKKRHQAEFESIATALHAEYGLERVRRLTPTERKEQELLKLAKELGVAVDLEAKVAAPEPAEA